jgi:RND family efflux transporter MFP subunit
VVASRAHLTNIAGLERGSASSDGRVSRPLVVIVPDQLSSDLASLSIDRGSSGSGGGAKRLLVWLIVLGAVGYAIYAFAVPQFQAQVLKTEVTVTEISTYSPMQAAVELTSSGYVIPQKVSRVGAKIPGRVSALHVKQGQTVKTGDLLIELEQADRQAGIQSAKMRAAAAEARVATARATVIETRQQAERERGLAKTGVSPAARADDLEARVVSLSEAVRASEAEVKAANAEVAALKVDLGYMQVRAPMDGTVVNKPPEIGEVVGSDMGTVAAASDQSVIELADFNTLMVETDIPEGRLHMAQLGSPCDIALDAFPDRRYRGEAVEINPKVDRAKATVTVKVKFVDPPEGVLPEMSARVSFLTKGTDEAKFKEKPKTVVPASALVERAGTKVLFVLEDDVVRMRNVTVGPEIGGGFEVLEGPSAGTRVVANPPATLVDGQRVKEKT